MKKRTVMIRNTEIGAGLPKICIPLVAEDEKGLEEALERLQEVPYDMVEWRTDFYRDVEDAETMRCGLARIRKKIGEKPLLFTFRTGEEGGNRSIEPEAYFVLNRQAAKSGLVDIVDALGGIDVMSEYEFTSKRMEIPNEDGTGYYFDSYSFSEGMNHLDGRAALAFSRERYSFAAGDIQRGKNQMAVIKAIVNKATSSSALSNYQKVLNAVSDAFITNMSYDDIAGLVKLQQKNMTGWNITSYSVYGDGGIDYTYSGGDAYVMYPDYDLVNNAQNLIQAVFNGEVPQVPED